MNRILAQEKTFIGFRFGFHIDTFDDQTNIDAALPRAEFGVFGALHNSQEALFSKIEVLALIQSLLPKGFVARNLDSVSHPVTIGLNDVGVDEGGHRQLIVLINHIVILHVPSEVQVEHDGRARLDSVGDDVIDNIVGWLEEISVTGAPANLAYILGSSKSIVVLVLGLVGGREYRHADAIGWVLHIALRDCDVIDLDCLRQVIEVPVGFHHSAEGDVIPLRIESADLAAEVGVRIVSFHNNLQDLPEDLSFGVGGKISYVELLTRFGVFGHLPNQG